MLYNTLAAYDWSFLYNETLYVVTLAADTDLQNGCIREPNFPFVSPWIKFYRRLDMSLITYTTSLSFSIIQLQQT